MSNSLSIVQAGHPVLRQIARELSPEEIRSAEIQELIQFMKTAMHAAPGVGLAAPQIGVALQLAVIEDREEYHRGWSKEQLAARGRQPVPFHVIINPKIVERSGSVEFYEGCLSVEGFMNSVVRAENVTVECLNERAEPVTIKASGWYARILQHEIDHLHGTLYIDRAPTQTLTTIENFVTYWKS